MIDGPDEIIKRAFDPDHFRTLGHQFVDQLADSLEASLSGNSAVRSSQTPEESFDYWSDNLDQIDKPEQLLAKVIETTFRCHHPGNMGHQVGPVLPSAALADLASSLFDTGNGVFEVGNPATPMERVVLKDLSSRLGLPSDSDGVLTSGGSLGNLTAMLAMRQVQCYSWDSGTLDSKPLTVLVAEEAHYCVERAVKIMGWGDTGISKVKVDAEFRMSLDSLQETYQSATEAGLRVIGVIGSAGSTATGRIDPLPSIAEFCRDHQLWFHVDAAHAGAFIFSEKAKLLLKGIERADSIVVDFHKMLLSPSLLTAVIFRRGKDSYQTFAQKADYLWREDQTDEWWDAAKRTMECTRPMLGLRAYTLLQAGRNGLFENYIDRVIDMTSQFADLLNSSDDFEVLTLPETNIICYRYCPPDCQQGRLDELNSKIRKAVTDSGKFYIVQVEKSGNTYLRSAMMNPFVTTTEITELINFIRTVGQEVQMG